MPFLKHVGRYPKNDQYQQNTLNTLPLQIEFLRPHFHPLHLVSSEGSHTQLPRFSARASSCKLRSVSQRIESCHRKFIICIFTSVMYLRSLSINFLNLTAEMFFFLGENIYMQSILLPTNKKTAISTLLMSVVAFCMTLSQIAQSLILKAQICNVQIVGICQYILDTLAGKNAFPDVQKRVQMTDTATCWGHVANITLNVDLMGLVFVVSKPTNPTRGHASYNSESSTKHI